MVRFFSQRVALTVLRCAIGVVIALAAGLTLYSQGECNNVNVGSDRMGVRFADPAGNWRYITPGSAEPFTLVRFSNMSYFGIRVTSAESKRLFGDCEKVYVVVLSAFVPIFLPGEGGKPGSGYRVPIFPAGQHINTAFFQDLRTHNAYLYTTDGTDLVVTNKRYYAAGEDGIAICELALCKPEDVGRLTGVVRDLTVWITERKAKKVRSLLPTFDKSKLNIAVEIEGAAGRESRTFIQVDGRSSSPGQH